MELLELTKNILRFKSVSFEEMPLVQYISSLLEENNIPHVVDKYNAKEINKNSENKTTANIYVECGSGEETLLIYSHLDVVPALDEQFEPREEGNKLFARGTSDMKSSLASQLWILLEKFPELNRSKKRILFTFIADEETSGTGIVQCMNWIKEQKIENITALLMEPSNNFENIFVEGKGYHFLDLKGKGTDVMESIYRIFHNKEELLKKYDLGEEKESKPSIQITKLISSLNKDDAKEVSGISCHASRPYLGINAVEKALVEEKNITDMHSDEQASSNTLPSKAWYLMGTNNTQEIQACIDIRTNKDASKNNELLQKVLDLINPSVSINIRDQGNAYRVEDKKSIDLVKRNQDIVPVESIMLGGSDATYLQEITNKTIIFGPGQLKVSHTKDEYVDIDVLKKTPDVILTIIKNFLNEGVDVL